MPLFSKKKRNIITSLLLITGIFCLIASGIFFAKDDEAPPSGRFNIVVIMVDDLETALAERLLANGYLPNLKKHIAGTGVTFRNSFVTTSLCCPSRATLLTGQYSHNHKVLSNELPEGSVARLKDSNTLVTWLHDAGYWTSFVGKYLSKYGSFPDSPATNPLNPKYIPPGWDDWNALVKGKKMYKYSINSNGIIRSYTDEPAFYQTDELARISAQAVEKAEANDLQPFFLWICTHAPHIESNYKNQRFGCEQTFWSASIPPAPRHKGLLSSWKLPRPPSFNEEDISDKPPSVSSQPVMTEAEISCAEQQYIDRAESMLAIDDLIGTLINTLGSNGELENTVLIFTSDNGYYNGEHRLFGKVTHYEESIRVPLYMRIPGITGPQIIERLAINNDLAPTITELANATAHLAVDGRSLMSIVGNQKAARWRKRFLVEFDGAVPAKYADMEFFTGTKNLLFGPKTTSISFHGVRTDSTDPVAPNQFYNMYKDGSEEHYDLSSDPYQLENKLYNSSPEIQSNTLRQYLLKLKDCCCGNCQTFEDE